MEVRVDLTGAKTRAILMLATTLTGTFMVLVIASTHAVGFLKEGDVSRKTLLAALEFFPGSAYLNARAAEKEMLEHNLADAERYASKAVNLSPYNYKFRLLAAYVQEARGDQSATEESLRAALRLAPNNTKVHWRRANMLLRHGSLEQALDEFRKVSDLDFSLFPATLDLVWNASGESIESLEEIAGDSAAARLMLARFLLERARITDSARVFAGIDRKSRLDFTGESSQYLTALINRGELELARDLWTDLFEEGEGRQSPVFNGGFESNIVKEFKQFDWTIAPSRDANISIDTATAREGARSLRIDFLGRDTTRLDKQIRQQVLVRPGARYRLECFFKTEGLVTPEGPRVVLTDGRRSTPIAASEPIAAGSSDWQRLFLNFVAPHSDSQKSAAIYIGITRKPRFSYDDPTWGTVWFDDFTIREQ